MKHILSMVIDHDPGVRLCKQRRNRQMRLQRSPQIQSTPGIVSELSTLAANTAEIDEVIVVTMPPPDDFFIQNGNHSARSRSAAD
jgi:hypothetical protein